MNILALDPGSSFGWAASSDGRIESGVQDFLLRRGESPGMRFIRFNRWMPSMISLTSPGLIVYERPILAYAYSAEILAGFVTRIQEEGARQGIPFEPVPVATLKKWATGRGNAKKAEMIGAARSRFPERMILDDNEADALILLAYSIEKYNLNKEV